MKVEVITSAYEAANGRKPKGTGLWLFSFGRYSQEGFFGTYARCKAEAVRLAKDRGISSISVCT